MEVPHELVINGIIVPPGKRTTIMLPMPKLYDWTPMNMPCILFVAQNQARCYA